MRDQHTLRAVITVLPYFGVAEKGQHMPQPVSQTAWSWPENRWRLFAYGVEKAKMAGPLSLIWEEDF